MIHNRLKNKQQEGKKKQVLKLLFKTHEPLATMQWLPNNHKSRAGLQCRQQSYLTSVNPEQPSVKKQEELCQHFSLYDLNLIEINVSVSSALPVDIRWDSRDQDDQVGGALTSEFHYQTMTYTLLVTLARCLLNSGCRRSEQKFD